MRLLNADGSRAEVSGNGVRALGALLLQHDARRRCDRGDPDRGRRQAAVADRTRRDRARSSGRRWARRATSGRCCRSRSPARRSHPVVLDMGNPQCVILGPLPDEPRFRRIGAALERHAMFPEGTNVEFAEVETPDRVRILIWERGVGPTVFVGHRFVRGARRGRSFGGAAHASRRRRAGRRPAGRVASRRRLPDGLGGSAVEGEWLRQIPRTGCNRNPWQILTAAISAGAWRRRPRRFPDRRVAALSAVICGGRPAACAAL